MLRSPALAGNVCPRSPLHNKPLPGRPRSISLPATPDIAELPGSLLLENQGFSPGSPVAGSATSQTMKSVRSVNVLSPSLPGPRPGLREPRSGIPQHKKTPSESIAQRRAKARPAQNHSPSSSEGKLTTCSASTVEGLTSSNDSARARAGSDSGRSLRPSPLIVERKNWRASNNEAAVRRNEVRHIIPPPCTVSPARDSVQESVAASTVWVPELLRHCLSATTICLEGFSDPNAESIRI